jgi:hypothetical protein
MFGYIESGYTVEKQADLAVSGGVQHFEIRQPIGHGRQAYIALIGTTGDGNVNLDTLLLYSSRKTLEEDWGRLVSDASVTLKELGHVERIEWHATGYGVDGSIVMY